MALPDLHGALWAWVQTLPAWQSDLLRRLTTLDEITEDALKDATRMVVATFGYQTTPAAANAVPLPALVVAAEEAATTRILALKDLQSVGSIESGQRLEFGETGLTVIFGETGSGKSSYARVLRKACRATDRALEILPNVLAPGLADKKAGTAVIELSIGDAVKVLSRDVNAPPEPDLAKTSFFDSDCAGVYADGESEITYTPSSLHLFERLASFQIQIKKRVDEAAGKLEASKLPTDGFDAGTKAGALVLALNENVNPETIKALANVTEVELSRLETLRGQLATVRARDSAKIAARLEKNAVAAEQLGAHCAGVAAGVGQAVVGELVSLNGKLAELTKRSQDLSAALSAVSARPVGGPAWKTLWGSAHDYVRREIAGEAFPPDKTNAAVCPLCHQTLVPEAAERFRRFEEYFRGEVERESRALAAKRSAILESFSRLPNVEALSSQATLVLDGEGALEEAVQAFLSSVNARMSAIIGSASQSQVSAPPLAADPVPALATFAEGRRRAAEEQKSLASTEALARAQREIAELENRIRLKERLTAVLERIESLKALARLSRASAALTTTGLSRKIGEFTESAVTAQLREKLREELEALRCDHLPVVIGSRGVKGRTQVSLKLTATQPVDVSDVLSEGERRAVALAFFLAEVAASEDGGGIILDDPVSSLDHARRTYVAQRLVQEAAKRQTIVFTHDVVFLLEIQDLAERAKVTCELRVVRRVGNSAGVASKELPWVAQNVGQRIKYLRNELQRLGAIERKEDPDVYRREVKQWFELLREAWERTVEEKLFNRVVQRFQPGIETLRLRPVTVTQAMTTAVEQGMTQASAWIHDQAPALSRPPPAAADLKAALEQLDTFVAQFKN